MSRTEVTASCLCGAIRLTYAGPVGDVTECHCTQCRRQSGHAAASFDADPALLRHEGIQPATWTGPGGSVRAFSPTCGGKLWFRAADGTLSIEAGAVDGPTGGRLAGHIHLDTAGDHYDFDRRPDHG
jgi:hypothetical protein